MYPGLSLQQAPPISVPFRFLITAPFFGASAHLILLYGGPGLLTNRWQPLLLAAVHLYVLGFLALTMMGALFQLLPVLVGVPVRSVQFVAKVVHPTVCMGVVFLALGFWGLPPWSFQVAAIFLLGGVGFFVYSCLRALAGSQAQVQTVRAMKISLWSLGVTVLLGGSLALLTSFFQTGFRPGWTNLHALWGLSGWVFLLLVGVSFKVLPMFFVTEAFSPFIEKYFSSLLGTLMVLVTSFFILGETGGSWFFVPILLLMFFFAGHMHLLFRKRRRPHRDSGFWFWSLGLLGLLTAPLLMLGGIGADLLEWETAPELQLRSVQIFLLVGVTGVMTSMYYKIVPFLCWLHLVPLTKGRSPGAPPLKIPYMNYFLEEKWARRQFALYALALLAGALHWVGTKTFSGAFYSVLDWLFYFSEGLAALALGGLGFLCLKAAHRHRQFWKTHARPLPGDSA